MYVCVCVWGGGGGAPPPMITKMNNSIFKVTFAGICPSLAYVGSINDYIDRKLWLKPELAFNYQTLQSCIISSFLKAVGSGTAG